VGSKLVLVPCLLVLLSGCGTGERERDAALVAERFHAALEAEDGKGACDALSEEATSKLEQQEEKPCEEAILDLDLPSGGAVAHTQVHMTSALTTLAEGGSDFLDEGPDGWRISAAGCDQTVPDHPYRCVLEG
jgi:hypothetical protein